MTNITKTTTDFEQFYTELLKDSMLQERLKAATDPESLSELAVELGKEKGYFFTKEEVLVTMAAEAAMGDEYMEEALFAEPLAPNCPMLSTFCTQNNNSSSGHCK